MTDIPTLVTCYNKSRFIADAMRSALQNSNEIFVVDDCSTDNSWVCIIDIAKEYGSRVHAHRLLENRGSTFATIQVLKNAKTLGHDVAILLDGDDVLAPNAAAHFAQVMETTQSDAVYGAVCRSIDRDRRGDAKAIAAFELVVLDDPLDVWFDKPKATTAVCGRICNMLTDLDPAARIQDHQLRLSIHRNSKRVTYTSGVTHYCSMAVEGENLVLDHFTAKTSAVLAYKTLWAKVKGHAKSPRYQRRAFSALTKTRKYGVFPRGYTAFLHIVTPVKLLLPSPIRHFMLMKSASYLERHPPCRG